MLRLSTHSVPDVCVCVTTSHHHQEDRLSHTDRILKFVVFFSIQPCSSLSDDLFLVTVSPLLVCSSCPLVGRGWMLAWEEWATSAYKQIPAGV